MPVFGGFFAGRHPALLDRGFRPFPVVELEQRQIEKPFSGIIDNIDMQQLATELAFPEPRRAIFEREPELADSARALRPARRVADEIGKVLFVGEARNNVVWLWLK